MNNMFIFIIFLESPSRKPRIISVTSLSPAKAIKKPIEANKVTPSPTKITIVKKEKTTSDPDLIPLHKGCPIKVSKKKLLEIYTEHPALYTIRLATIVFGKETLSAVSKESEHHAIDLLDKNILNSLISKYYTSVSNE